MKFLLVKDWAVGSAGGTHSDLTVPAGTHAFRPRRRDRRDQDKSGGWQVREALSAA
jgi:hypothetical protein